MLENVEICAEKIAFAGSLNLLLSFEDKLLKIIIWHDNGYG